ncbi:hypothetical protein PF008_g6854 [Phytophthora fragariae]|uniref:Uncharacterized protein n=1 Tax=Phytophthora fragariae TaxID=53985 RepID=A0A6G0S5T9_9STRA|nr:hypothetical protein PF008_g6854 [Phytophthora fragariae]
MNSKTSQAGTTVFTYKPYMNASALEDSNKKASLSTRIRWLEKFQSMAVQGGWSDKMRIYEMKLEVAVICSRQALQFGRRRTSQLEAIPEGVQGEDYKAKTSDSERYYSTTQKKMEAPLEFFIA